MGPLAHALILFFPGSHTASRGKSFHLLSNHEIVDRIVEYDPMFRIVAPLTVPSSS